MKNQKIKFKNLKLKTASTLIELAVVIAIVLILVAVGAVVWFSRDELASRNDAILSTNALVKAMAMYKAEQGDYPPESANVVNLLGDYTDVTRLLKNFRNPPTGGAPTNGIQIYRNSPTNDVVCIWGELKDVSGEYEVRHCLQTNGGDAAGTGDAQPACFSQGIHSWQGCALGM